ncbi:hypothetical protein NXS19_013798 [Fusarium pseudograminearum]|nr:hypothetical protein NXS19_013798 [Fusarium pseudograminearum]
MVLRQRQVETIDRHRPRSPSPIARVREERIIRRPRSISPSHHSSHHSSHDLDHDHEHERSRTRVYERERVREPSQPPPRRAPSPARVVRYVERPKSPSPHLLHRSKSGSAFAPASLSVKEPLRLLLHQSLLLHLLRPRLSADQPLSEKLSRTTVISTMA